MSNHSGELTRLIPSLIKARKEIPSIDKDKKGQFKYASIEEILETVIPILLANDIFLSQVLEQTSTQLLVVTKLFHSSGQWMQSSVAVNDPSIFNPEGQRRAPVQELGSNITYMKRYSIAALLGLIISEDDVDDYTYTPTRTSRTITEKQVGLINIKLKNKPHLTPMIYNKLGIESVTEIPINKFNDILKWIDTQ